MEHVVHYEEQPAARTEKTFDVALWPKVVSETKAYNHTLAAMLGDAAISDTNDGKITLAFKFKFHSDVIAKKQNSQIIEKIIEKVCGPATFFPVLSIRIYRLKNRSIPKKLSSKILVRFSNSNSFIII